MTDAKKKTAAAKPAAKSAPKKPDAKKKAKPLAFVNAWFR